MKFELLLWLRQLEEYHHVLLSTDGEQSQSVSSLSQDFKMITDSSNKLKHKISRFWGSHSLVSNAMANQLESF